MHVDEQMLRGVESQGVRRLYPQNYEHKRELHKLTHSVLTNFLDLLDVLVTLPESSRRAEKVRGKRGGGGGLGYSPLDVLVTLPESSRRAEVRGR